MNPIVEEPNLPNEFIKIIPHPHSIDSTPIIIPLTLPLTSSAQSIQALSPAFQPRSEPWSWVLFKTLADFEYTETAIQGLLSKKLVNKQLAGINSSWAKGSNLTIKNYNDMDKVLTNARKHTVQVRTIQIFYNRPRIMFQIQTVFECHSFWHFGWENSFLHV